MLEDSLYLQNIEEYVQDESKVTCKSLSRTLSVPMNAAKKMLFAYVSQQRMKGVQLVITYIVTGLAMKEENYCHKVCLVEEDDLEDTKKQFSEIWGTHIYSVQKAKLKDLATLYAADFSIRKANLMDYSKWSTIDPKQFERLSLSSNTHSSNLSLSKDIYCTSTKVTSICTPQLPHPKLPHLSHMEAEPIQLPHPGTMTYDQSASVPAEGSTKQTNKAVELKKEKAQLKGSVANFFANIKDSGKSKSSATKNKDTTDSVAETTMSTLNSPVKARVCESTLRAPSKVSPVKNAKNQPKKPSPHKSLDKAAPKSPKKRSSLNFTVEPHEHKSTMATQCLHDSDIESDCENDAATNSKKKVSAVERPATNEKLKKIKVMDPPEISKPEELHVIQRKRKRVQNACISSDEEEELSGNDTRIKEIADDTHIKENLKTVSNLEKKKKRVKRLVTKMYTTEDGSLVTERVMESFSEDECEPEQSVHTSPKKVTPSLHKDKDNQINDSKKGTKQATLMSFFHK